METETRSKLHQLLDQMIDEGQPLGTFSFARADDNFNFRIKTYKLFLDERDFFPGA